MNIEKEKWLVISSLWLNQFEIACDLLNIIPTIPASRIFDLYRSGWRPFDAATLLLSWGN